MPKASRKTKRVVHRRTTKASTTAIVPHDTNAGVMRLRAAREREQIELIKQTCCKGASDDEFRLFMWVAKKHRLDPLTRQLHAVFRNLAKHHQDEKGIWVSGKQMTIQVGIDGYRAMAARYPDFGAIGEPEYEYAKAGDRIPVLARVKVWKKGLAEPTVGIAYWDEYAPNTETDAGFFWKKMPKGQLAKCAEALALRKAYPELSDLYTDEEMHQHDQDFTASGRQIFDERGFAPSGRAVTFEAQRTGTHEAAQAVAAAKIAGTFVQPSPEPEKPPVQPPRANIPNDPIPVEPVKPREWLGTVEIDWTVESDPIVRGDISNLLELLQKHCSMVWKDDWWHVQPRDRETIAAMCEQLGYKLLEVLPKVAPPSKPAVKETASKQATAPAGKREANTPAGPSVVSCTIERVNSGMAGKNPVKHVTVLLADRTKPTYSCFDKKWFDAIEAGLGKFARLVTKQNGKYINIVGALTIGSKEWDNDGVPVVQVKDREAGATKTLF